MKTNICKILFALLLVTNTAIAEVKEVDSGQLQALLNQDAIVVDVRRIDEWRNTGIIDNSIPLTFFDQYGAFDAAKWLTQVSAKVGTDKPVVLICEAGVRSKWVADWMDHNTEYSTIYNATEGMRGWIEQGYPVVDNP